MVGRKKITLALVLLIGILPISAMGSGECGQFPDPSFEGPQNAAFKDRYENLIYMYAVTIPKGLTGYSSPPPSPQHGFGIVLSWEPRSYLFVDSSANSLDYKHEKEALENHLRYLKGEAGSIVSRKISRSLLGKAGALRQEIHYKCPGSSEERVQIMVISLRTGGSLVDMVELDTTATMMQRDLGVFDRIVKSWRITGTY